MSACRICGGSELATIAAREMFIGTREVFQYQHCRSCGTRQLADPPADPSGLYQRRYFDDFAPRVLPSATVEWFRIFAGGVKAIRSVLDVGCALGALPKAFARAGARAVGVDPYAPVAKVEARAAGWTFRSQLDGLRGRFDLIVASHVLEHVNDVRAMLHDLTASLEAGGRLVVTMPFCDSPIAEHYGPAWIGLDPGRHVHVLTRPTFVALAHEAGLKVERVEDQTLPLNVLVSSAWREDIAFAELGQRRFSPQDIARAEQFAATVRSRGLGDAWAYSLSRRVWS